MRCSMYKKVILVHGYFKNHRDVMDLKKNLEKLGYEGIVIDLPLTFHEIKYAYTCFQTKMKEILDSFQEDEKVSLVGHSAGGLIIRMFLSNTKDIHRIHRCVFISTPNKGCRLADIASKRLPILVTIFKTLKSLTPANVEKLKIKDRKDIEIGIIAGNKSDLILGKLIRGENDGRVELYSTKYEGSTDSITLPYNHNEIHHQFEVAQLVDNFLRNGGFHEI